MSSLLIAERLTASLLSRRRSVIALSDACLAIEALDSHSAFEALESGRWNPAPFSLYVGVEDALGAWAYRLSAHQRTEGAPLSVDAQRTLACGLEMRLRPSATGRALVEYGAAELGCRSADVDLCVISSNTFVRNTFARSRRIARSLRSVKTIGHPGSAPLWNSLREHIVASSLRSRVDALRPALRAPIAVRTRAGRRVAALFVAAQRPIDLFRPVQDELERRGWIVVVFHYGPVARSNSTIPFSEAISGRAHLGKTLVRPRWQFSESLLSDSPVSQPVLELAMDASWETGNVQSVRHHRLLDAWRPDVVLSYGQDISGLALQTAARSLGIPSVSVEHFFREPLFSPWRLHATASALLGPACVEANAISPYGEAREGLFAIGHPTHDSIFKVARDSGGRKQMLSGLELLGDRRLLVVALATWAVHLFGHRVQLDGLRMLAESLPEHAFLLCKTHPSFEERELCQRILEKRLPEGAFRIVGEADYSTRDLLAACDVVVVVDDRSMSLSEAAIMAKPAIAITYPGSAPLKGDVVHPYHDVRKVCQLVENAEQLRAAFASIGADGFVHDTFLRSRREFLERVLVLDGRSTERLSDLVEHLGEGKEVGSFVPRARENS